MTVTLELDRATKSFGSVHALVDGSILLRGGEVHALLGENGAGKSTLVKILAGVYQPDGGELRIDGEPTVLAGTAASRSAGISVIYQEPTLFPDLSVAENIFMGRQPLSWGRHIDRGAMNAAATKVFERLGVALDPTRPARGLSVADQQIVEIAKAISFDARVIVMDEPTAALTAIEVERLFTVVRTLRAEGAAVLFISHRLEEVFANCQRVTIMRDGRFVRTDPIEDLDIDTVIRSMVGRDLDTLFPKTDTTPGEVVLSVEHLSRRGEFNDVSFTVRRGEIVALAGLVGAGRSEIARAIFGIDRYDAGRVEIDGNPLPSASPIAAMRAGVGFVPEDRRQQGLVMEMSIDHNVALASLRRLQHLGLLAQLFALPGRRRHVDRLRRVRRLRSRSGGHGCQRRQRSLAGRHGPLLRRSRRSAGRHRVPTRPRGLPPRLRRRTDPPERTPDERHPAREGFTPHADHRAAVVGVRQLRHPLQGVRPARGPHDPYEKIADAAEVHRVTGVAPRVSLHIPWDRVDDYGHLAKHAVDHGLRVGAINTNVFQDDDYKLGSVTNPDPRIRRKATDHLLACVDVMDATGSSDLKLWFSDGTNYPGQDDLVTRQERLADALAEVYDRLGDAQRFLLEYKFFEPAFYATDVPDWGTSYMHCAALGPKAMVVVDTGHHAPARTSSSSWRCCCGPASSAASTSTPASTPTTT